MSDLKHFLVERGWISAVAFAAALIFCFVIFPYLTHKAFLPYDIDGHGGLGQGLYHCKALSFYPSCEPTIQRAPVYPLIVFGLIAIHPSWYPYTILVFQCFIFGAIIQVVFSMVLSFASIRKAQMISLACALHPYLIWFTSRIWIELCIVLLFTSLMYSLICYSRHPTLVKAGGIGILLGIACLTKQTFLPYIFLIPIGLYFLNFQKKECLLILLLSMAVISPWTIRNWKLTHSFIPIQLLLGYNMQIGDYLVEHPLSKEWWLKAYKQNLEPIANEADTVLGPKSPSWQKEIYIEHKALNNSLKHYLNDPLFLLKKMLFNTWAFWFVGGINSYNLPALYIFFLFLQGLILLLFVEATWRIWRYQGIKNIHSLINFFVWLYFLSHLPVLSESRFSLPLIPTMMAYGFGWPAKK